MLTQEQIAKIVLDYFEVQVEFTNADRLQAGTVSEMDVAQWLRNIDDWTASLKKDLARGDFALAGMALEFAKARVGSDFSKIETRQLEQGLLRTMIEVLGHQAAQLRGDFAHRPSDPLLKDYDPTRPVVVRDSVDGWNLRPFAKAQVPHPSPGAKPSTSPSTSRPVPDAPEAARLHSVGQTFLVQQEKDRVWDRQTRLQAAKSFALFAEVAGDRPLSAFQRSDAREFKETLQALPADYGKAASFRGRTPDEILSIDKMRGGAAPRLSLRTVKRHVSALSSLWRWAVEEKQASENIFAGFSFPSQSRVNEQRDMWSQEELTRLFRTPIYSGCRSPSQRTTVGTQVIKDEKYWLPLIAIFSGLRQEEICQLHLDDVKFTEKCWVFDVNARPPRKLKNRNAVRKVPVHSRLKAFGLLGYADELRAQGETMLFPALRRGGADDRLGHSYSKWFARYRQAVGLYRRGLDFHSFRHTCTTLLQRAGVPLATIDELTGHATPGETARYSHGLTMQQLADAIESIDLDTAPIETGRTP